jgi:hypothetical protein
MRATGFVSVGVSRMARTTTVAFRLYLATRGKGRSNHACDWACSSWSCNQYVCGNPVAGCCQQCLVCYYSRQGGISENCGYATLAQCRAPVLGLGGWCRPNPFPGTAFGTGGTWSSGPPRQKRRGYYGY